MPDPILVVRDTYAAAMLPRPAECPSCHRATQFVINRKGHTLCFGCDSERLPAVSP